MSTIINTNASVFVHDPLLRKLCQCCLLWCCIKYSLPYTTVVQSSPREFHSAGQSNDSDIIQHQGQSIQYKLDGTTKIFISFNRITVVQSSPRGSHSAGQSKDGDIVQHEEGLSIQMHATAKY